MRLVRGAPGTGKTRLVFREFKESLADGRPGLIVVPTATLVRHYQHELARDGLVFSPSAIVSLNRLAGAQSNPVVLRAAIRRELATGNYPEYESVADAPGLVATLVETLELLVNAGAKPNVLLRHPVVRLWKAVEAALPQRNPVLPSGKVWLDGFLSFSPLDWELVKQLNAHGDVTLTLPDDPTFGDIRRAAIALGAKDEPLYGAARQPSRIAVEAPSAERETEEIARRILALREDGVAFRQIAVALRDTGAYLNLLRSTFERFNIPARFYFSEPLATHAAARFLNGIVENTLGGWDFESTIAMLRAHPLWRRQRWLDWLDMTARARYPDRGAEALLELCTGDRDRKAVTECTATAGWALESVRARDWAERLTGMALTLFRPGQLPAPDSPRDVAAARSFAGGLRAWCEAIECAAECWPAADAPLTLADFWTVAKDAVDSASIPSRDDRANAVHVMSVFEARQWDVEAMFVCGMTARDFPQQQSLNLLFTDDELRRIAKIDRAKDAKLREEVLRVTLESRAAKHLIFTCPARDAAGKSVERSQWLAGAPAKSRPVVLRPRTVPPRMGRAGAASAELLQMEELSATSLEDLMQCRFKYFATRVLGWAETPESPRKRISALNSGNAIHKALELWARSGRALSLVDLFDREFENMVREKRLPPGFALETERMEWRRSIAALTNQDNWAVVRSEPEVDLIATLPGGVRVKCRTDRLDELAGGKCIIIDYKTGALKGIKDNTRSEVKLQGPLYALAAAQNRNLETVAMMYYGLQDDRFFGWGEVPGRDVKGLEEMPPGWMQSGAERADQRLLSLLAGEVHAEPAEDSGCRYCRARSGCRVEEQRVVRALAEAANGG